MENKLFVGGLSFETTEDDLRNMFSHYGTVQEVVIIKDRETRRSKGFGFVTFEDSLSAKNAAQELDGKEADGRKLKVNEARPREPRGGNFRKSRF